MPPAAGTAASLPEALTGAMWASLPTAESGGYFLGRAANDRPYRAVVFP